MTSIPFPLPPRPTASTADPAAVALRSMAAQGAAATAERDRALSHAARSDAQGLCVEARAHHRRAARADLRQAVWHEAYELLAAALHGERAGPRIPAQPFDRTA